MVEFISISQTIPPNLLCIRSLSVFLHFERRHPKRNVGRAFRFESMWLKDLRCEEVVHEAWDEGKLMGMEFTFKNCLDWCRVKLDVWNKLEFGHVSRMIA